MGVIDFRQGLQVSAPAANRDEPIIPDTSAAVISRRTVEYLPNHGTPTKSAPDASGDCPVVRAYDRVCQANDIWSGHIPGENGDRVSASALERAYHVFYATRAGSLEGLRLQFESLVAIADIEGDERLHPRVLTLLESMRAAFLMLDQQD